MAERLLNYAKRWLADRAALAKELKVPLLLWESAEETPEEFLLGTEAGAAPVKATAGQPLVLEVKKGSKPNPFTMGVTIGRTATNDMAVPHRSVSRFHAYFRQDTRTGAWSVVDAESKNGTWVGPLKIKPNRPEAVTDGTHLRFGSIEVKWLLPATFITELEARMSDRPRPP